MAKYFYPEEFQDIPKSQKKKTSHPNEGPSKMTLNFLFGYGAALSVLNSAKIGKMNILLN